MRARRLVVALALLVSLGLAAVSLLDARADGPISPVAAALVALVVLSQASVGAVLAIRLRGQPIGWLLLASGLLFATGEAAAAVADHGLVVAPGSVPAAPWLAWLSQWADAPAFVLSALFVPLVFPTGRLPSPRWRPVAIAGGVVIALNVFGGMFGDWTFGQTSLPNPIGTGTVTSLADAAGNLGNLAGIPLVVLVIASLVGRYRSASGIEHLQLRWFAYVGIFGAIGLGVGISLSSFQTGLLAAIDTAGWVTGLAAIAALPIAVGVAILRYRLYEIDVLIRRTAVYVPLTAILAGLYAATISLLQRLFVAATGTPSDGAVILSTLVLATTFTPIKGALQSAVDRRFGAASDAADTLAAFASRLANAEWQPDPIRTIRSLAVTCASAFRLSWAAGYFAGPSGVLEAGLVGQRSGAPVFTVPIAAGGQTVGRLELGGRRSGQALTARERQIIESAASEVAAELLGLRPSNIGPTPETVALVPGSVEVD